MHEQHHAVLLHRIDHRRNMARYYSMEVAPSLFGDAALVRSWGRLDVSCRMRIDLYPDRHAARRAMVELVRKKLAKGYRKRPQAL